MGASTWTCRQINPHLLLPLLNLDRERVRESVTSFPVPHCSPLQCTASRFLCIYKPHGDRNHLDMERFHHPVALSSCGTWMEEEAQTE